MRGILPGLGGLLMYAAGGYALQSDWTWPPSGYTFWTVPGLHWEIGGIFIIAFLAAVAGVARLRLHAGHRPSFFKKETLTRGTPTLVPDPTYSRGWLPGQRARGWPAGRGRAGPARGTPGRDISRLSRDVGGSAYA